MVEVGSRAFGSRARLGRDRSRRTRSPRRQCSSIDDADDDNDGVTDVAEQNCGGNATNPNVRPERVDDTFVGKDDDGDTVVDEALPGGSADFDCDGDGYRGSAEDHVFSYLPQTDGNQKTCADYDAAFPTRPTSRASAGPRTSMAAPSA